MRKILLIGASFILFFLSSSKAQKITKLQPGEKGMYPTYLEFSSSDAPTLKKGSVIVEGKDLKAVSEGNAQFIESEKDEVGYEHHRYQQTSRGIPVEDAFYVLHVKGGKVLSENGKWVKDFPSAAGNVASLSEESALAIALQKVNAVVYKWQVPDEESFLKAESKDPSATFYPKGKLVYYSKDNDVIPTAIRLAYRFDIYSEQPLSRQLVYVDAQNGTVLGTKDLIHTADSDGTAVTVYSGTQPIKTTFSGGVYILREIGRGNGIKTLNLRKSTDYGSAVNFTDADNYWNNVNKNLDQYATDAHWGAEKTYDFYLLKFKRNSIDGNGFALNSYVHYSRNYFNAFWDGSRMTYGDGSSTDGHKPLTALDVCGHEITHGLTSFTANLNYSFESGALNEGFSDIFGTAIEFFARPAKADWLIGSDFYTIRSMSNPNNYQQPDTYKGTFWYTGTSDNGGVHTNSGVLNFWFYLLAQGGVGTNDKNFHYNVTGIGISRAQRIAYRTLTKYLISTSVYKDARTLSIKAAQDLFGVGSNQAVQTANAWDAVGVTAPAPIAVITSTETAPVNTLANNVEVSSIYPNPVRYQFIIEFKDTKIGTRNIVLYNILGGVVYQKNITSVIGKNRVTVGLPNLTNGSYIIKINEIKAGIIQVKQ